MALIFALSADPDPGPDLGSLQAAAAYLAHFTLYAALWTAFAWALRFERPLLALVLTVAFGVSDEVHQSFVEGRDADPVDLLVDGAGAMFALLTAAAAARRASAPRRRRPE